MAAIIIDKNRNKKEYAPHKRRYEEGLIEETIENISKAQAGQQANLDNIKNLEFIAGNYVSDFKRDAIALNGFFEETTIDFALDFALENAQEGRSFKYSDFKNYIKENKSKYINETTITNAYIYLLENGLIERKENPASKKLLEEMSGIFEKGEATHYLHIFFEKAVLNLTAEKHPAFRNYTDAEMKGAVRKLVGEGYLKEDKIGKVYKSTEKFYKEFRMKN